MMGLFGGLGAPELLIVLFIILLLFGGKKLPELARSLGNAVSEYSRASSGVSREKENKESSGNEERKAILEAAKKMGIETEGRDLKEIAKDIVNGSENKE